MGFNLAFKGLMSPNQENIYLYVCIILCENHVRIPKYNKINYLWK